MRWASVRLALVLMASTVAPWGKRRMEQPERVGKGAIHPRNPPLVMAGPCRRPPRLAKPTREKRRRRCRIAAAHEEGKRPMISLADQQRRIEQGALSPDAALAESIAAIDAQEDTIK